MNLNLYIFEHYFHAGNTITNWLYSYYTVYVYINFSLPGTD